MLFVSNKWQHELIVPRGDNLSIYEFRKWNISIDSREQFTKFGMSMNKNIL